MMKATAKYLFDEDFASGEKPTISMVEHERRRADAESQAYRNGFTAGQEQAQQETAQRVAGALSVIADALGRLDSALTVIETRHETEAVEVAVAVGSKLAPELVAREPFAEISALATECFHQLASTPHVAVRIAKDIYESAKEKIEEIARARGFEGRLAVISDETLAPGDCRIEWADGGMVRDQAATMAAIDEMVARYIAARNAPTS
ncbi:MAG TPA: FliH/SctL family protein [Pseudolabrys sp.]|jgi:flagellar assembly protein FliH|nr:FliH/SctL family protein [Pseudolabrys sp.]